MRGRVAALLGAAALLALSLVPPAARATLAFNTDPFVPEMWVSPNDDGTEATAIGRGLVVSVSPNGEYVAYEPRRDLERTALSIYDVDTGKRWVLVTHLRGTSTFAWSPDSTMVAALRSPAYRGKRELDVFHVRGGMRRIATGYFRGVSFSPDSTELVFGRAEGPINPLSPERESDLVRASVDGGEVTTLTHDGVSAWPLWGPRGKIAFVERAEGEGRPYGPQTDIYLVNPAGGRARRLTDSKIVPQATGLFPAVWSPAGAALIANFLVNYREYGVVVDPRTGTRDPLAPGKLEEGFAAVAVSPDGGTVFGDLPIGARDAIASVPITGGTPTVLVREGFSPSWGFGG
jgi:dipeptidyl aminopeptidase/acylaminoacyl peptidase